MKRSQKVALGFTAMLAATLLLACEGNDDDDCDDESMSQGVWTREAPAVPTETLAAPPATGGFGTHLSSCGG